nr:Lrp/AsnC ligand binding domain-containing protein [Candidatus Njordarchaeum guaymaensis]
MYACILIRVIPGNVLKVLEVVKGVKGVVKAFPVYGRYDIVAFVEASDFSSVIKIAEKVNATRGIKSTETATQA